MINDISESYQLLTKDLEGFTNIDTFVGIDESVKEKFVSIFKTTIEKLIKIISKLRAIFRKTIIKFESIILKLKSKRKFVKEDVDAFGTYDFIDYHKSIVFNNDDRFDFSSIINTLIQYQNRAAHYMKDFLSDDKEESEDFKDSVDKFANYARMAGVPKYKSTKIFCSRDSAWKNVDDLIKELKTIDSYIIAVEENLIEYRDKYDNSKIIPFTCIKCMKSSEDTINILRTSFGILSHILNENIKEIYDMN